MSTHELSEKANHNEQLNTQNENNLLMRSSIKEELQDTPCFVAHSSSKEEHSSTLVLSLKEKEVSEVIVGDGIEKLEFQKGQKDKMYSFQTVRNNSINKRSQSIEIMNEGYENYLEDNNILTDETVLKQPTSSIMELKDHKTNKKEIDTNQKSNNTVMKQHIMEQHLTKLKEKDSDNVDHIFEPEVIKLTQNRENYLTLLKLKKEIVLHPTKLQITEVLRRDFSKKRPSEEIEQGFEFNGLSHITIGQEKCIFLVTDELNTISQMHASLHQEENDRWSLTDEGSINGTYLIQKRIKLHVGMKLIVGSFIMRVLSIESTVGSWIKKLTTLWINSYDTLISDFQLSFNISRDSPTCVGKDYQEQLKEDIQISPLHFKLLLLRNSQGDDEVILENEQNVFNKVGEQIIPYIPLNLPKDQVILRFGLLKIFHVKITAQLPSHLKCYLCSKPLQSQLILSPCQDVVLSCLECLLTKSQNMCPSCKVPILDFSTHK